MATAVTDGICAAAASTAAPPKLCPTSNDGARCPDSSQRAAATRSATFDEKLVFAKSPSEPPSPVKSKRNVASPASANASAMSEVALLSFEQVKQCANNTYACGACAPGMSSRAASGVPCVPGNCTAVLILLIVFPSS